MLVSALISMWVMNTSTTLMLLPIGLAICSVVAKTIPNISEKDKNNFDRALLLSIAYAATIGGMSTLVGTAPNIVFSSFMQEVYGLEISMIDWMKLGVPVSICMLYLPGLFLQKLFILLTSHHQLKQKILFQKCFTIWAQYLKMNLGLV